MKVFITSGGFVANHLKIHFAEKLTDRIQNADVIINTVGILKEQKHTYKNSHIDYVKNLISRISNTQKLIHISALGSQINHPSGYKHTKAVGEQIIKENIKNYAIIKPSIILGPGQKLYDDLRKFKNIPFILAPKMKVQPVKIEKLIQLTDKIIYENLTGEFELCGEKTVSMKGLFKEVFESFGKKPLIIEMPKKFFKLVLPVLSKMDIMGKDEYLMIEDNICKG